MARFDVVAHLESPHLIESERYTAGQTRDADGLAASRNFKTSPAALAEARISAHRRGIVMMEVPFETSSSRVF